MDEITNLIKYDYKKLLNTKYFKNYNDNHLIHLSVIFNNLNLLKDIIKKYGKKIFYLKNKNGENILHLAAKYQYVNIINFILENEIKLLNYQNKNGDAPYHYLLDDIKLLYDILNKYKKKLKENKINLNLISNINSTLINNIITKKKLDIHFKIIKLILDIGINPNIPFNFPPLINAVINNNFDIVNLFLEQKNINININDLYNKTAIYYATRNNNIKIIKLLIDKNIKLNHYSPYNSIQYINYVLSTKISPLIHFILDQKIDLNILDLNLNVPLANALELNLEEDIIKKLLVKTTNLNFPNINGKTAMDLLSEKYKLNKFKEILDTKNLSTKYNDNEEKLVIIKTKNYLFNIFNNAFIFFYLYITIMLKKYNNLIIPFSNNLIKSKPFENKNNNILINKINYHMEINDKYGYKLNISHIFWVNDKINYIYPEFEKSFKNVYKKKKIYFNIIRKNIIKY